MLGVRVEVQLIKSVQSQKSDLAKTLLEEGDPGDSEKVVLGRKLWLTPGIDIVVPAKTAGNSTRR